MEGLDSMDLSIFDATGLENDDSEVYTVSKSIRFCECTINLCVS